MSRKDYELIAKGIKYTINSLQLQGTPMGTVQKNALVENIGERLANDNSRFDYSRFRVACGLPSPE